MTDFAKRLAWPAAALVLLSACVYFRSYPLVVYPRYAAENNARLFVYSQIQKAVRQKLASQNLKEPLARQSEIQSSAFKEVLKKDKKRVEMLIRQGTRQLLKNVPPSYLMEVDPYYYLSLTEKLLRGEEFERQGREYFNPLMLAPDGFWYAFDFHPYTGLFLYRAVSLFSQNVPLESVLAWTPVVLAGLCLLPFFFLAGNVFRSGPGAAMAGGLYLILCPAYLKRSLVGWYDTDGYNIFFPLLILFFLLSALNQSASSRKKTAFFAATVLFTAVYSLFWRGWFLVHALLMLSLLIVALAAAGVSKERWSAAEAVGTTVAAISPLFFIPLFWGWIGLESFWRETTDFVNRFYFPAFKLWPDVFLTVGELGRADLSSFLKSMGGWFFCALALAGIIAELIFERKNGKLRPVTILLLLFLFTGGAGVLVKRFSLLAAPSMALGIALAAKHIFFQLKKLPFGWLLSGVAGAVFCVVLFFLTHQAVRYEHSIYNSSWDKMMTYIREKTPAESIVTTWWSPGHFITSKGKRRVTFDGATQDTPQAYWTAHLFLEPDEEKALAILRLLDVSGNRAVEHLTDKGFKLSEAVALLHEILPMKKSDARKKLMEKFAEPEAEELLLLTHAAPPPSYLFVYDDMIKQVMALEYIGRWNFEKAEKFAEMNQREPGKIPRKILKRSSKEYAMLMWSLSEGPYAQDEESYEERRSQNSVYFNNGLTANLQTGEAELFSKKFGFGRPRLLYRMKNGVLEKQAVQMGTLDIAALIIEETLPGRKGTIYKSVLADPRLIESLAFRLFYLKGAGLKNIHLEMSEENIVNRNKFYLYRVDWPETGRD